MHFILEFKEETMKKQCTVKHAEKGTRLLSSGFTGVVLRHAPIPRM